MGKIGVFGREGAVFGWESVNHSVSLSVEEHRECKGNSIYFMDNYWDWTDEDYSYGGHD